LVAFSCKSDHPFRTSVLDIILLPPSAGQLRT
jgi:hypothetical protein